MIRLSYMFDHFFRILNNWAATRVPYFPIELHLRSLLQVLNLIERMSESPRPDFL